MSDNTFQIVREAFQADVLYFDKSDSSVRWSGTHNHFISVSGDNHPIEAVANHINAQQRWRNGILNIIESLTHTAKVGKRMVMKYRKNRFKVAFILALFAFSSCVPDPIDPCVTCVTFVSYKDHRAPGYKIIQKYCTEIPQQGTYYRVNEQGDSIVYTTNCY